MTRHFASALFFAAVLSWAPAAGAVEGWAVFADGGRVYRSQVGGPAESLYNGSVAHAKWAADGASIYFIKTSGEIWRMANDGSDAHKIADGQNTSYSPIAAYRPDADFLLYLEGDVLYKVDGASGARTPLRDEPRTYVGEIAISSSGTRIAARGSDSNLYRMADGSSSTQYATTCSSSISPDGSLLTANVDGHTELTIHNWGGGVHKTLHAPSGKQWDNQSFAVNSSDYVVYKHDNEAAIGVVQVSTDTTTFVVGRRAEHPDFFVGTLPAPTSPPVDDPPVDDPPVDDPPVDDPPVDDPPVDDPPVDDPPADGVLVIEAETMTLSGYDVEGDYIATLSSGTATATFAGAAGDHNLAVTIIKENDGQPSVDVFVADEFIATIHYALGSSSRDPETIDLGVVAFAVGDAIRLEGTLDAGAAARLDKVTISQGGTVEGGGPGEPPAPPVADLPTGYFVWSKGELGDMGSRKIYRMTLPDKSDERALTSGEDIGAQVSPDGRWVAYAKARLPGGTDYHDFDRWSVYIVRIDGIDDGNPEIEIDAEGYWPSWGGIDELYYNRQDGSHSLIMRVVINDDGSIVEQTQAHSTRALFPEVPEINETFMAPDGSWFAGRTRGTARPGVGAYSIDPPSYQDLGWAGSVGCMPYVAPSGAWGFHAGSTSGIRWGDAPWVPNRQVNQELVAAKPGGSCYHPGISTDEKWFMTGHSSSSDQNAGDWDIYIYKLDGQRTFDEQLLAGGGFNGWPVVWVDDAAPPTGGGDPGGGETPTEPTEPAGGDDPTEPSAGSAPSKSVVIEGAMACNSGIARGALFASLFAAGLLGRRRRRR